MRCGLGMCYSKSPAVTSLEEFTQLSSQGRSMNVIVNGQSSEVHETNAGLLKGPVVGSTLFLLSINGMPRNILRLLVNNYIYIIHAVWLHLQKTR